MVLVKLARRGNSIGISIPRPYLKQLKWARGDLMFLPVTPAQTLEVQRLSRDAVWTLLDAQDREGNNVAQAS